jgi:hypothetical protein
MSGSRLSDRECPDAVRPAAVGPQLMAAGELLDRSRISELSADEAFALHLPNDE